MTMVLSRAHRALLSGAAALALLAAVAPPVLAARRAPSSRPEDPRLTAVLQRLDRAQGRLEAFTADLVETRTLSLLSESQTLEGRLTFQKPGRIRWEYRSPERKIYLLDGGQLTGWLPDQRRLEKVDLRRHEKRLRRLVGMGQDAAALRKEFKVTLLDGGEGDHPAHLELVPRSRRVRRHVARIELWLAPGTGLPDRFLYETADGDQVLVRLENMRINPELPAGAFRIDVPEGVEIVTGKTSFGVVAR
ncbi:MAG: outer membrane lipoprotein carrier protein LolA [Acidobacteriota bacterium]|nr:outer membrane lipoprotein carrier protein LolA [Acidobacteriota bacterium]MDQ7087693.1 outer membrane lipoprotein carrier protein LolA [Acidobacteriota bacterium]